MIESITIGQVVAGIITLSVLGGVLAYLGKIYKTLIVTNQKIENNDLLTKTNLKATKVMLDHFIEDKIGDGEFKQARKEIDEVLIGKKGA